MKKRTTRTFSIDDILYERFEKIVKDKNINKSKLIESMIQKFVDIEIKNNNVW